MAGIPTGPTPEVDPLELLAGDAQVFLDDIWSTRVHVHHADPDALAALLSMRDVDRLITASGLRAPALRVVKDQKVQPDATFTRRASIAGSPLTGLVDPAKVLAAYDDGATLVLQGLHRYWPPLTGLVRRLEHRLGHPCQANAYLTPPGSQGFARHSDSHDVFVFQTAGRKQWEYVADGRDHELLLEPGLSAYLPTGTPHSARSEDVASLHVTIGVKPVTWRTFLTQQIATVLADPRYDRPLPAGFLDDPERLVGAVEHEIADVAGQVARLEARKVTDLTVDRFQSNRPPALIGGLLDRQVEIDDDTVLARRETAVCRLRPGSDHLVVILGDRALRMPGRLQAPLEFIAATGRFSVADLAEWLDPQSRLVLCRRLVREGLLRVAS